MEKKLRLRAPNFTASDYRLLCDIIAKFKHYIENKKTDGASLQQKHAAWLEVVNMYNSSTTGYARTLESLQQAYKNFKKKAKKSASDAKMVIPGGGSPTDNDNDPLLEKVKDFVGPVNDDTIYDGDSDSMCSQNKQPIEDESIPSETMFYTQIDKDLKIVKDECKSPVSEKYSTNDRAKKKPNHLLTRKRKLELETLSKKKVSEKLKKIANERMELVALQQEILRTKLEDETEKLAHNRKLRAMEMAEMQKAYAHNDVIRNFELDRQNQNK